MVCRGVPVAQPAATKDSLRLGLIGCGGQGRSDARNASRFGRIVAVCDVDESHVRLPRSSSLLPMVTTISASCWIARISTRVICGTVDHWHTLVAIAAMRAGKDIYCEKPLTLTIDEGKRLVKVQEETGRILQTGTQQRSDVYFRLACNLVRSDRIGKLEKVEVWLPAGLRQGPFATSPVPRGFDFDFWMGQTSKVDYVKERTHFSFRYWWEYSGGTMTDWGAPQRYCAVGDPSARRRTRERRRQAAYVDDPRRIYGGQRV